MKPYRFTRPPQALRQPGVQLDNIIVVPASLLPYKKQYQQLANAMPRGSVLLSQTRNPRLNQILERTAVHLKQVGRRVITLPAEWFVDA